jgi:ATP-binding cassette subfamily C (CFTR/MRP) protein 1
MDLEDRAYLLTAANARWLSVRLDFLGALLVFAVAIMAAKGGAGLTSAQIALCLTYLVSLVQLLGMVRSKRLYELLTPIVQVTRQSAEVENNSGCFSRRPVTETA